MLIWVEFMIMNKIKRAIFIIKKYDILYLFGCLFRFSFKEVILRNKNNIIKRDHYKLFYSKEPFLDSLFINPKMIREDEQFIRTFLKKKDIYIDVGANIGTTTLCASSVVGPDEGLVICFEPHPRTFSLLEKNISLNGFKNIQAYNVGVGERKGRLTISDTEASDANHLIENGAISVEIETLDRALQDVDAIRLLKIDVEGFEEAVFRGAENTLKKTEIVFFESYDSQYKRYGFSFINIFNILQRNYFFIYKLTFTENSILFTEIDSKAYHSSSCENICASKSRMPSHIAL